MRTIFNNSSKLFAMGRTCAWLFRALILCLFLHAAADNNPTQVALTGITEFDEAINNWNKVLEHTDNSSGTRSFSATSYTLLKSQEELNKKAHDHYLKIAKKVPDTTAITLQVMKSLTNKILRWKDWEKGTNAVKDVYKNHLNIVDLLTGNLSPNNIVSSSPRPSTTTPGTTRASITSPSSTRTSTTTPGTTRASITSPSSTRTSTTTPDTTRASITSPSSTRTSTTTPDTTRASITSPSSTRTSTTTPDTTQSSTVSSSKISSYKEPAETPFRSDQTLEIMEDIERLKEELRRVDKLLDDPKQRWERKSKSLRLAFDSLVITTLSQYNYQDVISVFTSSLSSDSPETLYKVLTILHIYLVPNIGLRTIHLGLHHSCFKMQSRDGRSEPHMNIEIDDESLLEKIHVILANVPQAIHDQNFLLALERIAINNIDTMHSLNHHQNRMALVLVAVMFDLWSTHRLKDQPEHIFLSLRAFPALKKVGQVWDYKTCWRTFDETIRSRDERKEHCQGEALYSLDPSTLTAAIKGRESGDIDQIEYQWGYAGAAIRMMSGMKQTEWIGCE